MFYTFGDCTLDTQLYTVQRAQQSIRLRPKVFQVLLYLLEHRHRVVPKDELVASVWPAQFVSDGTVESTLRAVRQVLGDTGRTQHLIQTLPGHGYRFVATVTLHEHSTDCPSDPDAAGVTLPKQADDRLSPGSRVRPLALPGWRQLTVLRCELVEGSALAGLDPDDFQIVLRSFYSACEQVVQRCNGYIAQYDSDGLLVYFGYPTADEAAAQQAVRAGLALVAAVQRLEPPMERSHSQGFTIRVGVHTGPVVVEEQTPPAAPVLAGATLILAKRVQACALPATVVLSAATYHLVQGYFTCQALAESLAVGKNQRLGLYRVLEESGRHTRFEVAMTRGLTPLVGREPELALLLQRWGQVQDGLGQVIMLCGEPGIGKSRLAQVLQDWVTSDAGRRIEWRGLPYYQHSAFSPVLTQLQRLLGWERDDPPEEKLHKLEAAFAPHPMGLDVVVPLFAALLSLPLPGRYPPLMQTPQRQKQHTLEALLAWLLAEAARQPVLLIVEDLHWFDPSTLELLTLVVDQGPTARLYSLFTFRPEFTPPWHGRAHLTPLTLSRLLRPQVEQMVQSLAGSKALPAELLTQIVTKTDGVPLFVEELTRVVLESEILQEDSAADVLGSRLPPVAIPATLQDSLMVRLDRLTATRALALLGATLGREFSYDLLQAVTPLSPEALQHGLRQLVEAEILYQRGVPPQTTYVFKHALIQDAAYQSLLKSTRQQYHQRIANTLEERFPKTGETQPELLAHHYTEAGHAVQAIPYWQRAGQQALQRSANLEATSHLTKGLDLLKALPETVERRQQELALQVALSVALILTRGYTAPEVETTCARARALCQESGDTPHLFFPVYGLFRFYILRGHLHTARELAEQLLRLAQQTPDTAMPSVAYSAVAGVAFHGGEFATAAALLEQSLALYNPDQQAAVIAQYGDDPGVICLSLDAWVQWMLGYPDRALQRSQEALAVARQLQHPFSQVFALTFAAVLHQFRREAWLTQEQAEAAIRLSTEQGFPWWLAWATIMRGWALTEQGQRAAGMAQLRQGLETYQATGANLLWPYFLGLQAEALGKGGQPTEGSLVVEDALMLAGTAGEQPWYEAELYRRKGELVLAQAGTQLREEEAEASFLQALDVARRQQAKSLELRAATRLARLWQRQGKRADAYQLLGEIYDWFTEGFDTTDLQDARVLLEVLVG
jgi:predicted ATPase/DNA-binding winged helix-turn-helix (wHTH) protein